jgi:hypothetical protein
MPKTKQFVVKHEEDEQATVILPSARQFTNNQASTGKNLVYNSPYKQSSKKKSTSPTKRSSARAAPKIVTDYRLHEQSAPELVKTYYQRSPTKAPQNNSYYLAPDAMVVNQTTAR